MPFESVVTPFERVRAISLLIPLASVTICMHVQSCATTHFFNAALSVLQVPISQISTTLCPDLRYQDHLVYHYTGGIVLAALRRYAEAAEFFELCASAPVAGPPVTNGGARGPSQGPIGMSLGGMGMGMGMGMGGMGYGGMGMGGMGMGGMGYGSMGYGGMGYGGLGYGMIPPGPGGKYGNVGSSDPSVFQIEAAKKLLLVQLILHGKVRVRHVRDMNWTMMMRADLTATKVHASGSFKFEGERVQYTRPSLPQH
jgi:hypothetical protein